MNNKYLKINLGGKCPVQADIYFLKYYGYFRARHSSATIEFYNNEQESYKFTEPLYENTLLEKTNYNTGYLNKYYCYLLIFKGCIKFYFNYIIKNKK